MRFLWKIFRSRENLILCILKIAFSVKNMIQLANILRHGEGTYEKSSIF